MFFSERTTAHLILLGQYVANAGGDNWQCGTSQLRALGPAPSSLLEGTERAQKFPRAPRGGTAIRGVESLGPVHRTSGLEGRWPVEGTLPGNPLGPDTSCLLWQTEDS